MTNTERDFEHAATCLGVKVPASPFLTEARIKRINNARYEGDEIAGALSVVTPKDRVLELGSGLGLVGSVIAANCTPEKVLSFEANPKLIAHIEKLYKINNLTDRISVRNQVVLTGDDGPGVVKFNLGKSFLGSSLLRPTRGARTAVEVATTSFDQVRNELNPTVLVMDIEGGELEFLQDADLQGIRAIVIEFHPSVYGVEGMRKCKAILKDNGFKRKQDVSTRTVWTATREINVRENVVEKTVALSHPKPEGGWSESIQTLTRAVVVPPLVAGFSHPAGVLHSDGRYCPEGALWRNARPLTTQPKMPEGPLEFLEGKWLWGGVMWQNFAHFIAESTTRLWALNKVDQNEFRGILFIPKRPRRANASRELQSTFLEMMGNQLPVVTLAKPAQVEQLVVPGQGFGLGEISAGTQSYQAAVRSNFARNVSPIGGEKLYISRSELGLHRGNLIGEHKLESLLEQQGYEIYHPQKHSIDAQVARYKAASHIIAAEGSALHVFAFAGREHQKLAIIVRRWSHATKLIQSHIQGFCGIEPVVVDSLLRNWVLKSNEAKRYSFGEIDFPILEKNLVNAGFISKGYKWENLSSEDVRRRVGNRYKLVRKS